MDNNNWNLDYKQMAKDSGFKLKQIKEGELDWRLLGSVDIESLVRTQHFQRLDSLMDHIAEAPLAKILDSNILDSGVVKYFHLAQLSVQYLLFCRRSMDESIVGMKKSLQSLRTENIQLKTMNRESNEELLKLHKKLQKLEDINQIVFPCSQCSKNFMSNEMLDTHIKRKHSAGTGKAAVENDINLINTIKLELEIKHLKERLNIAEREIREKQQNSWHRKEAEESEKNKIVVSPKSKDASTDCSYVSVGTQTDTNSTRSVGIQNNLEEPKELDESSNIAEKFMQQEIVIELRDKLAILEEWKKKETTENERSIAFIKSKVDEMLTTVNQKLTQIQSHEKSDIDNSQTGITQDDIKEMQKIFTENLGKICRENELKLTNTIRTFENGYRSKLENLENLIVRYEESLNNAKQKGVGRNEMLSRSPIEINDNSSAVILSSSLTKNSENVIEEVEKSPENDKIQTVRYIRPVEAIKRFADTESELSEVEATSHVSQIQEIRTVSKHITLSSTETDESEDDKSDLVTVCEKDTKSAVARPKTAKQPEKKNIKENVTAERTKPTLESIRSSAVKLFNKRLKLFGLKSNNKTLSKQAKDDISALLVERRNVLRKKHPNYFAVRNKLRQSIEKTAKAQIQSQQAQKQQTIAEIGNLSPPTSARQGSVASHLESADSTESENEELDVDESPIKNEREIPKTQVRDEFKARLERILASPIRKLVMHMRAPTLVRTATPTISESPPESGRKKPVPTPRKKVMFDMNSSDSNSSLTTNQERLLSSRKHTRNSEDESNSDHPPPVGIIKKTNSESSSISSLLK